MSLKQLQQQRLERRLKECQKIPENRYCFDCRQRNPTCVCLSFGTFVCMSCMSVLRQLNYKVVNISMHNFTETQVAALEQGGNARAQQIWLKALESFNHFPLPAKPSGDQRDYQRLMVKLLHQKYVTRRWCGDSDEQRAPAHTPVPTAQPNVVDNRSTLKQPQAQQEISRSAPIQSHQAPSQPQQQIVNDIGFDPFAGDDLFSDMPTTVSPTSHPPTQQSGEIDLFDAEFDVDFGTQFDSSAQPRPDVEAVRQPSTPVHNATFDAFEAHSDDQGFDMIWDQQEAKESSSSTSKAQQTPQSGSHLSSFDDWSPFATTFDEEKQPETPASEEFTFAQEAVQHASLFPAAATPTAQEIPSNQQYDKPSHPPVDFLAPTQPAPLHPAPQHTNTLLSDINTLYSSQQQQQLQQQQQQQAMYQQQAIAQQIKLGMDQLQLLQAQSTRTPQQEQLILHLQTQIAALYQYSNTLILNAQQPPSLYPGTASGVGGTQIPDSHPITAPSSETSLVSDAFADLMAGDEVNNDVPGSKESHTDLSDGITGTGDQQLDEFGFPIPDMPNSTLNELDENSAFTGDWPPFSMPNQPTKEEEQQHPSRHDGNQIHMSSLDGVTNHADGVSVGGHVDDEDDFTFDNPFSTDSIDDEEQSELFPADFADPSTASNHHYQQKQQQQQQPQQPTSLSEQPTLHNNEVGDPLDELESDDVFTFADEPDVEVSGNHFDGFPTSGVTTGDGGSDGAQAYAAHDHSHPIDGHDSDSEFEFTTPFDEADPEDAFAGGSFADVSGSSTTLKDEQHPHGSVASQSFPAAVDINDRAADDDDPFADLVSEDAHEDQFHDGSSFGMAGEEASSVNHEDSTPHPAGIAAGSASNPHASAYAGYSEGGNDDGNNDDIFSFHDGEATVGHNDLLSGSDTLQNPSSYHVDAQPLESSEFLVPPGGQQQAHLTSVQQEGPLNDGGDDDDDDDFHFGFDNDDQTPFDDEFQPFAEPSIELTTPSSSQPVQDSHAASQDDSNPFDFHDNSTAVDTAAGQHVLSNHTHSASDDDEFNFDMPDFDDTPDQGSEAYAEGAHDAPISMFGETNTTAQQSDANPAHNNDDFDLDFDNTNPFDDETPFDTNDDDDDDDDFVFD